MAEFVQADFNRFIISNKVIGFFDKPITLKSGRQSFWYVNWRTVAEDVFLLDQLTDYVLAFTSSLQAQGKIPSNFECFYGVPEGATKLAVLAQYKLAKKSSNYGVGSHVLAMGRAKPKDHGAAKDKYFVGAPRGKTVVLEDVTTTGGSLLTTIDGLIDSEIPVIAAFGLTNRMEKRDDGKTVSKAIAEKVIGGAPVQYYHLSNALELLPEAARMLKPSKEILAHIEKEFSQYGEQPIRF